MKSSSPRDLFIDMEEWHSYRPYRLDDAANVLCAMATTVLVLGNNDLLLRTLARFLQGHDEVQVVGTLTESEDVVEQAAALQPEVILLDPQIVGVTGLRAVSSFRDALPDAAIIVVSLFDTETYRNATLAAGADEFVSKSRISGELLPAIRRAVDARRRRPRGPGPEAAERGNGK